MNKFNQKIQEDIKRINNQSQQIREIRKDINDIFKGLDNE